MEGPCEVIAPRGPNRLDPNGNKLPFLHYGDEPTCSYYVAEVPNPTEVRLLEDA